MFVLCISFNNTFYIYLYIFNESILFVFCKQGFCRGVKKINKSNTRNRSLCTPMPLMYYQSIHDIARDIRFKPD
jgi:hypothetical protein